MRIISPGKIRENHDYYKKKQKKLEVKMSEKKKSLSRRSFLKGATSAGVVAAVAGGGLFVQKLEAQGTKVKRGDVKEPPGVKKGRWKPMMSWFPSGMITENSRKK